MVLVLLNTIALASPAEHPAKAELLADVSTVQPGKAFQVAVRMTMTPGWHIYWIDPGDSGQATTITWHVPDGWKVEPLPFPTPHKFVMPGDIVNNGYANEVLFLATVTPPADAKGSVELSADVEWLVCDVNRCLPGNASPKLTLSVAEHAVPADRKLFETWLNQVPVQARAVQITDMHATLAEGHHSVSVQWKVPAKDVEMFPSPSEGWLLSELKTAQEGDRTLFTFVAKPQRKPAEPGRLILVAAYTDEKGVRRGLQLSYTLK